MGSLPVPTLHYLVHNVYGCVYHRLPRQHVKILVIIGYGFGDEHINSIIAQALAKNSELHLVVFNKSKTADVSSHFNDIYNNRIHADPNILTSTLLGKMDILEYLQKKAQYKELSLENELEANQEHTEEFKKVFGNDKSSN